MLGGDCVEMTWLPVIYGPFSTTSPFSPTALVLWCGGFTSPLLQNTAAVPLYSLPPPPIPSPPPPSSPRSPVAVSPCLHQRTSEGSQLERMAASPLLCSPLPGLGWAASNDRRAESIRCSPEPPLQTLAASSARETPGLWRGKACIPVFKVLNEPFSGA